MGIHPEWATSSLQGNMHLNTRAVTLLPCFMEVRGNCRPWWKPTQTQGQHEKVHIDEYATTAPRIEEISCSGSFD